MQHANLTDTGAHTHNIADAGSHSHSITDPGAHSHGNPVDAGSHTHPVTIAGPDSHSVSSEATPLPPKADNEVDLDDPIVRGSTRITRVALRKPYGGELRGLTLNGLANLDVDSLHRLIPRISTPTLTPQEAQALSPADLLQFGGVIGGFLLPKRAKASMDLQTA